MLCLVPSCAAPSVAGDCVCQQHKTIEARAVEQHRMVRESDIAEMRGEAWPPPPPRRLRSVPRLVTHDGTPYGLAAMRSIVAELAEADGGRNNALNRAAFSLATLVAGAQVAEHEALHALRATAEEIGLPEWEAKRTIRSGWMKGLENPRVPSAA